MSVETLATTPVTNLRRSNVVKLRTTGEQMYVVRSVEGSTAVQLAPINVFGEEMTALVFTTSVDYITERVTERLTELVDLREDEGSILQPARHPFKAGTVVTLYGDSDTYFEIVSYDDAARDYVLQDRNGERRTVSRHDTSSFFGGNMTDWLAFMELKDKAMTELGYTLDKVFLFSYNGKQSACMLPSVPRNTGEYIRVNLLNDLGESLGTTASVYVSDLQMTGKTQSQYRDSFAPEISAGNVIALQDSDKSWLVTGEHDGLWTVVALTAEGVADPDTVQQIPRYTVAEVEALELSEDMTVFLAVKAARKQALAEAAEKTKALSINTVNRALAHAHKNDYCSETLIALTSAGHKIPKVKVSGEIVIPVEMILDAQQQWSEVRNIFGQVQNNGLTWQAALLRSIRLQDYLQLDKLEEGKLTVEPIYGDPTIRPLA